MRDRGGDLTKEWYFEYYAFDEASNDLIRRRIKIPTSLQTKKARMAEAVKIISDTNTLLEKGFYFKIPKTTIETDIVKESSNDLVVSLDKVLETIKSSLRPKTAGTHQSAINKLKDYANEKILDISEFTDRDAIKFRDYLISSLKNTSRTANNTLIHLNTVYGHLKDRVKLEDSPFKLKKLKQVHTKKNIAFTDEDRARVEQYMILNEPELYLLTRVIYYAFNRPRELNSLKLHDIRLNDSYVIIRGEFSKNGKTETVPIIPALMKELKKLDLEEKRQFYYLFGKDMRINKFQLGKQIAFRRHEKVLKKLNLLGKGYTLYSWKHTGAVNAYLSGVGIKQLQLMLRHSTVQMTDIYLKSLGLRTDPNIENYNW
ncbi:tyrosine-type recombinase/integrase [Dyadobacter psychrotolerans]|uniref:Site-specific integrase n=1 Tax=Dyadobacter psychrotolerans TaxID=2541721 RepID=A0A4V2Z4H0_9BACT|nr:site-specific integrase [Dyadobacter psychrotolerans]TDE16168.1 site-specific integrase [Dyadobacter psychrotolerans]